MLSEMTLSCTDYTGRTVSGTGTGGSIWDWCEAGGRPMRLILFGSEYDAEIKLHDAQMAAREAASNQYASQHLDKYYGQVIVNGEVFATVFDSGVSSSKYYIKQTEGAGSGIALAEIRLKEIAAAVGGRIIYSNFLPDPTAGISARGAPENLLPKVTARSFAEIMQELKNTQQLANYTITINTVEQYNALMAVKNNIGQNWSAQQWNAYLQDIPSAASATIDTSA